MSDTTDAAEGPPAAAFPTSIDFDALPETPDPEPEAEEPEAEDTEPEAEEEAAEEPEAEPEVFDRTYVEKLRDESAKHRVELKGYKEAFAGYTEEQAAGFLDIAKGLSDPDRHVETAGRLVEMGKSILDHYGKPLPTPGGEPTDPDAPMTYKQYQDMQARSEEAAAMKAQIASIEKEIGDLGYTAGTPDHAALLHFAQSDDISGDMAKADEKVKEWKQSVIDTFVSEQRTKQGKHLKTQSNNGSAPADLGDAPKDWADARAAVQSMLG